MKGNILSIERNLTEIKMIEQCVPTSTWVILKNPHNVDEKAMLEYFKHDILYVRSTHKYSIICCSRCYMYTTKTTQHR